MIGYGAPDQAGSFARARQSARRRRGEEDEAQPRLARGASVLHPDRGAGALPFGARARQDAARTAGTRRFAAYAEAFPELARGDRAALRAASSPTGWDAKLPSFPADAKGMATRKASEAVLQELAQTVPELVGGSGDLDPSTYTWLKEDGDFESPLRPQRRRRRGPSAAAGATRAATSTSACASTPWARRSTASPTTAASSRSARRSSCSPTTCARRSGCRRIAQPARDLGVHPRQHRRRRGRADPRAGRAARERCARSRASSCLRPCDANETRVRVAGRARAARRADGARADAPARAHARSRRCSRRPRSCATRRLRAQPAASRDPELDPDRRPAPRSSLIVAAEPILRQRGVRARLVSMPSWELFERAERRVSRERAAARGDGAARGRGRARRSAGSAGSGSDGDVLSVDRFGASAPGEQVLERVRLHRRQRRRARARAGRARRSAHSK